MVGKKALVFALCATLSLLALPLGTATHALARGYITVTPSTGSQWDTFEFDGSGFVPYECLHTYFISPGGDEFDWNNARDGSDCIYMDRYGSFQLTVLPGQDLAGSQFGVWEAHFETDRNTQVTLNFTVLR